VYPGPELQPSQVATLIRSNHVWFFFFYTRSTRIWLLSVDDQPVDPTADDWALLAGPHTVEVALRVNHFIIGPGAFFSISPVGRRNLVSFLSRPGRRYRIDGRLVASEGAPVEFCAWVEDTETGETIAGSCDPQPRPAEDGLQAEELPASPQGPSQALRGNSVDRATRSQRMAAFRQAALPLARAGREPAAFALAAGRRRGDAQGPEQRARAQVSGTRHAMSQQGGINEQD